MWRKRKGLREKDRQTKERRGGEKGSEIPLLYRVSGAKDRRRKSFADTEKEGGKGGKKVGNLFSTLGGQGELKDCSRRQNGRNKEDRRRGASNLPSVSMGKKKQHMSAAGRKKKKGTEKGDLSVSGGLFLEGEKGEKKKNQGTSRR